MAISTDSVHVTTAMGKVSLATQNYLNGRPKINIKDVRNLATKVNLDLKSRRKQK
jgi:hypothetical protein